MTERWISLLRAAREKCKSCEKDECEDSYLLETFLSRNAEWNEQLSIYIKEVVQTKKSDNQRPNERMKEIILDSRAALRFGLLMLSFENAGVRQTFQNYAVKEFRWHKSLVTLLSQRKGDSKCRLFAARLLSNLVTANPATATEISSSFPLCPSKEFVSSSIFQDLAPDEDSMEDNLVEGNWVDMILSAAKSENREAMAAITAALHNCIVSLKSIQSLSEDENPPFVRDVATNSMLISILLRHFVSAESVKNSVQTANDISMVDKEIDPWDSATDWIYILFTKLSRLGMLPSIYSSIFDPTTPEGDGSMIILPEQNVLLHCIVKETETFVAAQGKGQDTINPLGGEVGWERTVESYDYLVRLFSVFCHATLSDWANNADVSDTALVRSGLISTLDILTVTLGVDSANNIKLRGHLGKSTELLQLSARLLGVLVDELTERSFGIKARELKISEEEQKLVTALVRLQGNMCFNCQHNQDLMRTTLVAPAKNPSMSENTKKSDESRNALHVLLSCTAFATACFTLREWSVIAIRNALENNSSNQQVVASLDAQNPIQSTALDQAGVRVTMDQHGKVSLETLNEDEEVG